MVYMIYIYIYIMRIVYIIYIYIMYTMRIIKRCILGYRPRHGGCTLRVT